jgi:hypothetical protein
VKLWKVGQYGEPAESIVMETRTLKDLGTIWHIFFLYPTQHECEKLLLVIVHRHHASEAFSIVVFEFWDGERLSSGLLLGQMPWPQINSRPLHAQALPNLPESFLIVSENDVMVLNGSDVASGNTAVRTFPFPSDVRSGKTTSMTVIRGHSAE